METNNGNARRQFFKNASLAALSVGILPDILKAGEYADADKAMLACPATTLDYYGQGPFYKANAPLIINNKLATATEPGKPLIISGIVRTLDCSAVIPDTKIDIWQANDKAEYDSQGFNLRGVCKSNAQGFYLFETILPGKYLNAGKYRPRHIHFKITPTGYPTKITQLYFEGDTDIPADAAASIKNGTYDATHRIIPIKLNAKGQYEGTWDIIVDGKGIATGMEDLHLDKGIIYTAFPNPFTDALEINYGIYQASKVTIQIFNMAGALAAVVDEKNLQPQKYTAVWNPPHDLPKGIYWVALKLNDLQVNYVKVVRV